MNLIYIRSAVPAKFDVIMSRSGPGAFIYTGSGKKQSEDADISQKKCMKQACAIQWCLARNDHKETKCEIYIQDWKDCCDRARRNEQESVQSD